MGYYLDDRRVSLADLQHRIERTDLVPSMVPLLEDIASRFQRLREGGIATLAELRQRLKNAKRLALLASTMEIDETYLVLLRREIEGYFPRPFPLEAFGWLPEETRVKLAAAGYTSTPKLYDALCTAEQRGRVSHTLGIESELLDELFALVSLTRIRWTNPAVARALHAAGYTSPREIAQADAEALCAAFERANRAREYFRGKLGVRDGRRLIDAAKYVAEGD